MPSGVYPRATKAAKRPSCGVYRLRAPSGNSYYGSSKNIDLRVKEHAQHARRGAHYNPSLNRAYAKYGALEISVVLLCRQEDLLFYEQLCIDLYKPAYNICSRASGPPDLPESVRAELGRRHSEFMRGRPSNRKGQKWTDEQRKAKSAQTLLWYEQHPEAREQARVRAIGQKRALGTKWSDEAKLAQSIRSTGRKRKPK